MKTILPNCRSHLGLLVAGERFRLEVALQDENGTHVGYGPGETIYTKQPNEARWFAPQAVYRCGPPQNEPSL